MTYIYSYTRTQILFPGIARQNLNFMRITCKTSGIVEYKNTVMQSWWLCLHHTLYHVMPYSIHHFTIQDYAFSFMMQCRTPTSAGCQRGVKIHHLFSRTIRQIQRKSQTKQIPMSFAPLSVKCFRYSCGILSTLVFLIYESCLEVLPLCFGNGFYILHKGFVQLSGIITVYGESLGLL